MRGSHTQCGSKQSTAALPRLDFFTAYNPTSSHKLPQALGLRVFGEWMRCRNLSGNACEEVLSDLFLSGNLHA